MSQAPTPPPTTSDSSGASQGSAQSPKAKKALIFLIILMLVNALAYGTIIPLIYPFAQRFGIGPVGMSLLFASFSLFQFLATPIMGRLSDQHGRRPLLLISLFGTGVSLIMFGTAHAVWQLFLARIIDGITGGNISVAQAVIADTTTGKERAKAFGMIGASFGFGFLLGPAIGGFLSTYGLGAPFICSGILAFIGTVIGYFFLEESLPENVAKKESTEPIFNFGEMITTLSKPVVGTLILVNLFVSLAFNAFILGSQSITNDVFKMTTFQVGLYFSVTGFFGIIMQAVGITTLLKYLKSKPKLIVLSTIVCTVVSFVLFFMPSALTFVIVSVLFFIASSPLMPVLSGLLSEAVNPDEQGVILGINQSYMSVGQIVGPLLAGAVTKFSIPGVFILTAVLTFVAFLIIEQHNKQITYIEKE